MSKTRKRQSVAEQRLKQEFPDIHADLVAGRIATMKKALMKAGLRPKPTPIDKLLKAWGKANGPERAQFLKQIGAFRPETGATAATAPQTTPMIANGRYLLPQTIRRIESLMAKRNISPAQVMSEAGFPTEGRPFTRALARNTSLRLAVIAALDTWLGQQSD